MLDKNVNIIVELKDKLTTNLNNINKEITGFKDKLKEAKTHLLALSAASTIAFTKILNDSLKYADTLSILNKQTGISVETLQKMIFVLKQSNVDTNSLTMSFSLLSSKIQDAVSGNENAIQLFQKMGISIVNSNGVLKNYETLMLEIADAIKNAKNDTEAMAYANELFGRTGKDLIPILKMGSDALRKQMDDAVRYGAVLDKMSVEKLDKFGDEIDKIKMSLTVLGSKMMIELLPTLNSMLNIITGIINNQTTLNLLLSTAKGLLMGIIALNVITFLANVKLSVIALSAEIGVIVASLSLLLKAIEKGTEALNANKEVAEQNKKIIDDVANAYDRLSNVIQTIQSGKNVEDFFNNINMSAKSVRQTLNDINMILLDPNQGFKKIFTEEQVKQLKKYKSYLEELNRTFVDTKAIVSDTTDEINFNFKKINKTIEETRGTIHKLKVDLSETSTDLVKVGKVFSEEYLKMVDVAKSAIDIATRYIVDFIFTSERNLHDFVKNLSVAILRYLSEIITKAILTKLILSAISTVPTGGIGASFIPFMGLSTPNQLPVNNITIISPIEDGSFWRNRVNAYIANGVNEYNVRQYRSFNV